MTFHATSRSGKEADWPCLGISGRFKPGVGEQLPFLAAAETPIVGERFNLGAGNPQPVNRLVELLGGDVVYIPKRPGEPDCTFADTTKVITQLGWKPEVSFVEGVARMVANIERWSDAPLWDIESIERVTKTWFKYLGNPA